MIIYLLRYGVSFKFDMSPMEDEGWIELLNDDFKRYEEDIRQIILFNE